VPQALVLTPNLREAEVLTGASITTLAEQREAARALGSLGASTVVVKGGHAVAGSGADAVDVVWDGESMYELRGPRVDTHNDHGTGCTFASATAAALARGASVREAVEGAKAYVAKAVTGGATWHLGHGHGPLDHFGWSAP
jgi:hydroxymethylpyrimidine/phosphomethylpyrimidine kinase